MMSMERMIDVKNAYLQMIIDLAFDYDGNEDAEGLKYLIDELSAYAKLALENNDKEPIYKSYNEGKEINANILMEDLD